MNIIFFCFVRSLLCSVPSMVSLEETKLYIGVDYGKPQLDHGETAYETCCVSCCCDECTVKSVAVRHC